MFAKTMVRLWLAAALWASAMSARADVFNMGGTQNSNGTWNGLASLSFVTVGNPGNASDTTGYGAVGHTYRMGTYDVTTAQYTAFLNAVATGSDPEGLYSPSMAVLGGNTYAQGGCGIVRNGAAGNYTYTVATAYQNFPVNYVSWGAAARFCNWLQNGQLTAPEGNSTTETGAYTLSGGTSQAALMAVTRNAGAAYFIPTQNEWYKAAYFDPTLSGGAGGYWEYPTKSNTPPGNTLPDTGNNANCDIGGYVDPMDYLTSVGDFDLSPGPFGTYDMGGDVFQWTEASLSGNSMRGMIGGSWSYGVNATISTGGSGVATPQAGFNGIGFRVASSVVVPEPSSIALLLAGAVAVGIWRLRRVYRKSSLPLKPTCACCPTQAT